jgi:16S rRNA (cytidine1402-2'-O)-methyltransferase
MSGDREGEDTEPLDEPGEPEGWVERSADEGELILVATPIGNLGDCSPRAVATLRDSDAIACEDTRHTRKLLSALGITGKRMLAVHEHNEGAAAEGLIGLLQRGQTIALVTDAGTPAISDPGQRVVAAVAAAGFRVTCVPGAAAVIVALTVSGLPTDRFVFEGFLPRSGRERKERLQELATESRTSVFYESPQRIAKTLADLVAVVGADRRISVSRELTKKFETTWRGTLADAVSEFASREQRGEFVVVLGGARVESGDSASQFDPIEIRAKIDTLRAQGMRTRDAVDAVSDETGVARRQVYAIATAPA